MVRPRPEGEQSQAYGTMLPRRVSIDEVPLLLSADIPALGSYPWYFYFSWLGPTSFSLLFFSSWDGCLIAFFFAVGVTCWCFHFPMHAVVSFFFACCLWLLYLILGSRTVVSACVAFTSSSVSVLQIHSVCCGVIA